MTLMTARNGRAQCMRSLRALASGGARAVVCYRVPPTDTRHAPRRARKFQTGAFWSRPGQRQKARVGLRPAAFCRCFPGTPSIGYDTRYDLTQIRDALFQPRLEQLQGGFNPTKGKPAATSWPCARHKVGTGD